jgi:hypothetical protein
MLGPHVHYRDEGGIGMGEVVELTFQVASPFGAGKGLVLFPSPGRFLEYLHDRLRGFFTSSRDIERELTSRKRQ